MRRYIHRRVRTNQAYRQREPWRNSTGPSRKQKDLIRQLEEETSTESVELSGRSSADLSDYIYLLKRRRARQTLTDKQEIYLTRLGYEGPWEISVDEASALITQLTAVTPTEVSSSRESGRH
jgi:hypothetical protein